MIPLTAATPAHAAALALIHASAFPSTQRWNADAMALQLGLFGTFGWIAEPGGAVLARVVADEAEILTLAVDPAARRRGIGTALLSRSMATAADRGAGRMLLEVGQANAAALGLYARHGFVPAGRRRDYYGPGFDALILAAPLPFAQP